MNGINYTSLLSGIRGAKEGNRTMQKLAKIPLFLVGVAVATSPGTVLAFTPLTDSQLAAVYAGAGNGNGNGNVGNNNGNGNSGNGNGNGNIGNNSGNGNATDNNGNNDGSNRGNGNAAMSATPAVAGVAGTSAVSTAGVTSAAALPGTSLNAGALTLLGATPLAPAIVPLTGIALPTVALPAIIGLNGPAIVIGPALH